MDNENFETISLDLTDEEFIFLAKGAHEADMTFNDFINKLLLEHIKEIEGSDKKE